MSKVASLRGHTSRVLQLLTSPDGFTIASAAGDETIRSGDPCFSSIAAKLVASCLNSLSDGHFNCLILLEQPLEKIKLSSPARAGL